MNNHQKGFYRDKAIVEALESHGVLNTDQITTLFFSGMKNGKRMAQKRLKSLHERGRIHRGRLSYYHPCHYYTSTTPGQVEHKLAINWCYVWTINNLKSWERLHCFEQEQDFGILRADGLVAIKNTVTGKMRFIFLELDRAESGNKFDKVQKYNQLYDEPERYERCWWTKLTERFPTVFIVTTGRNRLKTIEQRVRQDNVHGLEFKIMLLDDMVGECNG